MIDSVNPFQRAFEVLSKSVTTSVLRVVQDTIAANRLVVTEEEALLVWPKVLQFTKLRGRHPDLRSEDLVERRYAEIRLWLRKKKNEATAQKAADKKDGGLF